MRVVVLCSVVGLALGLVSLQAQNIVLTGALPIAPTAPPPAISYHATPIATVPVVAVPVAVGVPAICPPPVVYHCGRSPDVIYFGGPYSHVRNYSGYRVGCAKSSVVYFGRGEAFERGYCFNHFR